MSRLAPHRTAPAAAPPALPPRLQQATLVLPGGRCITATKVAVHPKRGLAMLNKIRSLVEQGVRARGACDACVRACARACVRTCHTLAQPSCVRATP